MSIKLGVSVVAGVALSVAVCLLVFFGISEESVGAQEVATDPVLVGAGDIALKDATGDEATARLIDNIDGTVFTTGDNVYPDGTDNEFTKFYDNYRPDGTTFDPNRTHYWGLFKDRTKPSAGNHEYNTPGASGYFKYFGAAAGDPDKGYYSYDLGDWHVVVLNSNCSQLVGGCEVGSAQEQWLKDDLAAHPNSCTLAYWHHPRFASGVHGNNLSVGPYWRALYQAGADVVLNGHDHNYERFAPQNPSGQADPAQGIREFVVGTGGAKLTALKSIQPNSEVQIADKNGVLKLTLHPEGYDWEFVTAPDATVADSGSGQCHGAPPPSSPDATAPTVQPPQQDLPTTKLGTSTIPTKISWSATDDGSGVASYELQQSVDGGAFTNVSLPSATSTTRTLQLQPGSTYQFRVRATDGAGNTSDWETGKGPAFLVDPHQENEENCDPATQFTICYAGSWTQQALSSAYGGGLKYSSARGSTAQFTFTGQNVAWVSTKGPNRGKATVAVDGVVVQTIDLYSSTTQSRKVVFSRSGLPEGSHTITVQVLGTKRSASSGTQVDVDAFVVLR